MLCDLKTFTRWLRHLEMLPSKRLHHAFKRSKENVLWTFRKCLHDWELPSSKRLHLNFTSYDLKSSTICLYDFAMEGPQNVFIIKSFEDVFNWSLKYLELQFHTFSQILNTSGTRLQICRPPADVLKTSLRARWGTTDVMPCRNDTCKGMYAQAPFNFVDFSYMLVNDRPLLCCFIFKLSKFICTFELFTQHENSTIWVWWWFNGTQRQGIITLCNNLCYVTSLIARFMGHKWGPSGADRTQVGPMLAPWTLLSGIFRAQHGKVPLRWLMRISWWQ